jgi:alpha-N-arabinofuranosidase
MKRSQSEALTVTADARSFGAALLTEAVSLHDDDVYAKNGLQRPDRVGLKRTESAVFEEGIVTVILPPVSWAALALSE